MSLFSTTEINELTRVAGVQVGVNPQLGRVLIADSLRSAHNFLIQNPKRLSEALNGRHSINKKCKFSSSWAGMPKEFKQHTHAELFEEVGRFTNNDANMSRVEEAVGEAIKALELETPVSVNKWTHRAGNISTARIFDGRENFMRRRQRVAGIKPVIGLGITIMANGGVSAEVCGMRAIIATVAAEILSSRGYPVAVYSIEAGYGASNHNPQPLGTSVRIHNANHNIICTQIKGVNENYSRSNILNGLSAWYFRNITFSLIAANAGPTASSSYGGSKDLTPADEAALGGLLGVENFTMMQYRPESSNFANELKLAIEALVRDILNRYN